MGNEPLRTVLYVDDEPDIRQVVELSLSLAPELTVYTGESGQRALELARELLPDLLLLDVMMPGMDGPETLRQLRCEPRIAAIPVVFMTAKTMPQDVRQLTELGAAGIIPKPFDPMRLASEVLALWEEICHRKSAMAESDAARVRQGLANLRSQFIARTQRETGELRSLVRRIAAADRSQLGPLRALVHKINGSGATFGFPSVSRCASEIERLCGQLESHASVEITAADITEFEVQIAQLEDELERVKLA